MSATHDLPDPLEKPAATPMSQSPDDLLSQMADDAIDKLIAEAEANPPPKATALPPEPIPEPIVEPPAAPPAANADDDLINSLLAEPAPGDAAPAPAAHADDEESPVATLASVLGTADSSPPPAAAPPAAEHHAEADAHAADASHAAPAHEPEISSSADVKALLADPSPHDAHHAAAPAGKSSPLLMPLELLSAPLTHADDKIRNAVGQIAILTLINAIAVLVYVLIVKHK